MIPHIKKKTGLKWEIALLPVFLFLFAILTCLHLLLLKNAYPGKILQNALQKMEQSQNYLKLDIQEQGPGYKIDFEGSFKNNDMRGWFPAYELEVYKHVSGLLYVRDLKDSVWKKTTDLELHALKDFFISPFEQLTTWSHLFCKAKFVKNTAEREKTIFLPIPVTEIKETALFCNYLQDDISRLECLFFLDADSLFINRIVFTLQAEQLDDIIKRTFTFKNTGEDSNGIAPVGVERLLENQVL